MLEVQGLTKAYGQKMAVRHLSFRVPPGSITGFLGPNGAGKTTTLRLILGLLNRDSGTISLDGKATDQHSELIYKTTGYVPDTPNLYTYLTGREFLSFVSELRKLNHTPGNIQALLEEFGLGEHGDYLTSEYSLGLKKRLMLAAALMHRPRLLILDEPTSGLDPVGIHFLKELLKEVTTRGGAVLMSTHLLASAQEIADRILIIQHGQLKLEASLSELLKQGRSLEETFLETISETKGQVRATK